MLKILSFLSIASFLSCHSDKPSWIIQESKSRSSLRGISAVNDQVAWASGSEGTSLRTLDGGKTWIHFSIPGADSLDFRDVEAFSADTAFLLSIGPGEQSRIYKTVNGGSYWALQFTNRNPKAFFDAMAFWDSENGIAFSDPVDGKWVIIKTSDGGSHWVELPSERIPPALPGEGAFAASGTCITTRGFHDVWIGTGGNAARIFYSTDRGENWTVSSPPILHDTESSGIFGIAFYDAIRGIAVGGDYKKESDDRGNVALTIDGGKTWTQITSYRPAGMRSAVVWLSESRLIAVGPSGSDISRDGGLSWQPMDSLSLNAVSGSTTGGSVWGVGKNGMIAKFLATP